VLGLLVNDPAQPQVRPTLDVDLVVGARTRAQFYRLQEKLRQRGFREAPEGPVCRWLVQGVPVDLMPAEDNVLGFTKQWYPAALSSAEVRVVEGMAIRVISPPCFLATKLEAFRGRGREDFVASHDLEDLVAVVDGRPEVVDETARAEPKLRRLERLAALA
jgi:predicted nucleotidyltransferase